MRLIGVTPTQDDHTGQITINDDYLNALCRAGALPVLLPLTDDPALLREIVDRVDGLVLSGGADVDPAFYGQETQPFCGDISPRRDAMELALCRMALEKDLPILAICRGEQVLNCVQGGTLYQDLAAQCPSPIHHPCHDRPREEVHTVTVEADSLLGRITGMGTLGVNSRHHQAVDRLGDGLRVIARAQDGVIEGVEMPEKRFVLGVQWHPESLSEHRAEAQKLFNAFVEACDR